MALVPVKERKSTAVGNVKNVKVLEEEEYTEKLEAIIKRDFFPDLHEIDMEDQQVSVNGILAKNYKTNSWDDETPLIGQPQVMKEIQQAKETNMSLNQFLATHTSEDNANFNELQRIQTQKWEEQYFWLKETEQKALEYKQKMIEGNPELIHGELKFWDYKAINTVYFHPKNLPQELRRKTNLEITQNAEPKVVYENTRFPDDGFARPKPKRKKFDVDEKGNELVNGFGMVYTPRINPNEPGNTPITTWGSLEATPLILNEKRLFKIPDISRKEILTKRLNKKIAKKRRKKPSKLSSLIRSVTPSTLFTPRSVTPGAGGLTPRAWALLSRDRSTSSIFSSRRSVSRNSTPLPTPSPSVLRKQKRNRKIDPKDISVDTGGLL